MIKLLQWEFFLDVISSIISSYQTGVWKVETSIYQIVFQEKQACQRFLSCSRIYWKINAETKGFVDLNWKKVFDDKYFGEGVLTDLPKAFDPLNNELLIAKLSAYGFTNKYLRLIKSYLTNRW